MPDAAKNDVEKQDECAIEDEFGAKDYRLQMILKPDCASRPLWVVRLKFDTNLVKELNLFCREMFKDILKTFSFFFIGTKWTYLFGILFSCV